MDDQPSEAPPLPSFLQLSRDDIHASFVDLEWKQRARLDGRSSGTSSPDSAQWARTGGPTIAKRNRYVNIEPFATNRIRLNVAPGVNDYINASPIVLGDSKFVCTQGPLPSSTSHFYRMLAVETGSAAVVIMLTQTFESGREKCFQYFPLDSSNPSLLIRPDPKSKDDDFHAQVTLLSCEEDAESMSQLRHLRLRTRLQAPGQPDDDDDDSRWEEKDVWHLLFGGWPDFGVPEVTDRQALVALRDLARRLNADAKPPSPDQLDCGLCDSFNSTSSKRPPSTSSSLQSRSPVPGSVMQPTGRGQPNPIIVHCSAGVGRSGTFIALDHLLAMLDAGQLDTLAPYEDPIAQVVDGLRQQRMMMVQTEAQYFMLYDMLRAAWDARAKSMDDAFNAWLNNG